jgi:Cellulase (glycosyl hydrolase family 5)
LDPRLGLHGKPCKEPLNGVHLLTSAQSKSWSSLSSFGLRNELRSPDNDAALKRTYNWETWTRHVKAAAQAAHRANPAAVVFLSGLGFDTDLSVVTTAKFRMSDWPSRKTALELHRYDDKARPVSASNCNGFHASLDQNGWKVMTPGRNYSMPVIMSEFGFAQDGKTFRGGYAQCLKTFFEKRKAGYMYWVLAGSYYIRAGKQDFDEAWGMPSCSYMNVQLTCNRNPKPRLERNAECRCRESLL